MSYIIQLIIIVVEAVITYLYFEDNYENKFHPAVSILIGSGIFLVPYSVLFAVQPNQFFANLVSYYAVTLLYAKVSYQISVKSALFHSAVVTLIMVATELVIETLSSIIFNTFIFVSMDAQLSHPLSFTI